MGKGLNNVEREIVTKCWNIMRKDSVATGNEIVRRFLFDNPTYLQLGSFGKGKTIDAIDEVVEDKRFKYMVDRVMEVLNDIVDSLDQPEQCKQLIQQVVEIHRKKQIPLSHFLILKTTLLKYLLDRFGTEVMNDLAIAAWSKAYDTITHAYQKSFQHPQA